MTAWGFTVDGCCPHCGRVIDELKNLHAIIQRQREQLATAHAALDARLDLAVEAELEIRRATVREMLASHGIHLC